jgi:hypothetical protein
MTDLSNIDWVSIGLTLVALAVIWFVVRTVLKLTLRIFACGCAVLGGLALAGFVLLNWGQITAMLGL